MASFLTTKKAVAAIDDIIRQAEKSLVMISYSVRIHETLFQLIRDAHKRKVNITLVYGNEKLKPETKKQLQQLSNLSLYFIPKLHAKCFFNEKSMVITSMNLYDYSENNWEMGVLVDRKQDNDVYNAASKEAKLIIGSSTNIALQKKAIKDTRISKRVKPDGRPAIKAKTGYCLHCGRITPFNFSKPYCLDCWKDVKQGIDKEFVTIEKYCHLCLGRYETSIDKPLCYTCWDKIYHR
jgi:hypothetical protein